MEISGKGLAGHLQKAISSSLVNKVSVFRFNDGKLFNDSDEFSFGNIGNQNYNLNRLVIYKISGGELLLYFLVKYDKRLT